MAKQADMAWQEAYREYTAACDQVRRSPRGEPVPARRLAAAYRECARLWRQLASAPGTAWWVTAAATHAADEFVHQAGIQEMAAGIAEGS
jgi:hypothetical protein